MAPTCTQTGTKTWTSAAFDNEAFAVQTVTEELPIDANAHAWGTPSYEWAEDFTSVTGRRVCANNPEHVDTDTAAATGVVTIEPTCTQPGQKTWTSAAFTNSAFTVQTEIEELAIDENAHDWGTPTYTWSDDNSEVTATRVCSRDPEHHKETETVRTTYDVVTEATETTAGTGRYTSAAFENGAFDVQTKDVEIPAFGYEVSYSWAADYSQVTATAVPYDSHAETITETVNTTSEVTKQPTCTETGTRTYTATFTSNVFAPQTEEVTIGALGHDLTAHPAVTETCETAGNSAY